MTTSDWHLAPDPQALDHFGWQDERLSQRKRFLFMAAVGRHIAALMTEPECVRVVEACEEFAEGVIDVDAFSDLHAIGQDACWRSSAPAIGRAANDYVCRILDDFKHNECIYFALDALGYVAASEAGVLKPTATLEEAEAAWENPVFLAGKQAAERTFLGYMHDVFGPDPYAPVQFARAWRTGAVESIARSMHASRDFSGMPVLADALQESGCDNPDILQHCRDLRASHVRGCWVVDLVLGKE